MKKLNERKNETGSILVEVIAVIALLGVMGPLLFRQVSTRNEEVENINIASEIRTLKEGFSAYILSEKARLLRETQGFVNSECREISSDEKNRIADTYLPFGNEAIDGYRFWLCKTGDNFLQGFIIPEISSMPESVGLKRSARIANLIGADGAICQDGNINGVAGGWGMEDNYSWCYSSEGSTMYLATTGMDTYVPEVTYEDYSASLVALPEKLALQDLHAWNYFSVGHTDRNCYTLGHNQTGNYSSETGFTASNDEIRDAGSNGCDPLFWVGRISGSDKAKGNVYVKNDLLIGSSADGSKRAVGLFHADTSSNSSSYDASFSADNRIEVYDNTGKERVIINGKGEIIAKGSDSADETLTMTGKGIKSSETVQIPGVGSENYKIDPSNMSIMNDIRLSSRGGAKLSDILPNYISRAVLPITENGSAVIPVPGCPNGYAPAVIVTPTAWNTSKIVPSDIADKLKTQNFTVPAGGGTYALDIEVSDSSDITVKNGGFKIKIEGAETNYTVNEPGGANQKWTVQFVDSNTGELRTDVKGLAQTYCVYDKDYTNSWTVTGSAENRQF